jgi:hypothetical protein
LWVVNVVVIAFTISSLVHLALGYALAIYLHGTRPCNCHRASTSDETPAPLVIPSACIESPYLGSPGATQGRPAEAEPDAAASPGTTEPERTDADRELLAGIEEFRNQLARLKSQRLPDDMQNPLSLGSRT